MYTALPELRINRVAMCDQSKLRHMFMNKLSEMYSGFSATFCLNYVAVTFLGTAKLVNIKIVTKTRNWEIFSQV